jgi:hypothetical protein
MLYKALIAFSIFGGAFAASNGSRECRKTVKPQSTPEQDAHVAEMRAFLAKRKMRIKNLKKAIADKEKEIADKLKEETADTEKVCKEHDETQCHDALAEESEFSKLFPGMDFAFGDLESQEVCDYADYEEDKGIFTNISFDRNHEEFKKIPNKHRALCSAILDLYTGKFSKNEKFVGKNHLERSWAKETDFTIYFSFIENDHERETTGSDPLSIYGRFRQTNDTPLPLSEPIGFRHDGQLIEVKPYGLCPRHDFERARDITTQQGNHTLKCYVNFQVKVVGRRKPFIFRALAQMDFGWN